MKQFQLFAAFAIALAAIATGCASETTEGSGELGTVGMNLIVGDTDVKAVSFELVCESGFALNGQFNVNDEQDPPIWAAIMDVPVPNPETGEACSIVLIASDDAGNVLCTGEESFLVEVNETVKVDVVLLCEGDGDDPLGNIDVDATFVIVEGNNCPRLHFLNAVPDEVPAEGSEVTVWVSDKDGDTLTTELTTTGGSVDDPTDVLTDTEDPVSVQTTYVCDGAAGTQTITVTVSDSEPLCDKSKSFEVTCPGVDLCEGVVCDDTGNECTVEECNPANGLCEESNVPNNTECSAGGTDDVADNGGVEEGTLNGWDDQFCVGTCEASDTMPNTGVYSARMFNDVAPSGSVLKQANKGIGIVQPNSQVTVRFAAKGNFAAGGVAIAEFFSEIEGGGTSSSEILGGGPLFTDTVTEYQLFEFIVTTGNDVSGGVTLQFVAATGAATGSLAELFIDDVVILVEGGGAGTCQEGVCVPSDLCEGVDCNDDNECTIDACNPADGQCESRADPGASCDGGAGTCDAAGTCQPNDLCSGVDCNDGNECTIDVCDPADGSCSNTPDEGASCDGGAGTCDAVGDCVPGALALYAQDFEPPMDPLDPDALIFDTAAEVPLGPWLFFGALFRNGDFQFGFGPFGAPNATVSPGTTFISAVVTGEGDAPQGLQQLSVFSDYNCCDRDPISGELTQGHGLATDQVEVNVFQEVDSIPASYIGQTITFSFDAKRGNIEGATTAVGFIKTLDPGAGFALTNFPTVDMTSIPATWNRYEVTLDLTDPALEGQILQIGFQNTAGNFEGSGIFYDNPLAELAPAAP